MDGVSIYGNWQFDRVSPILLYYCFYDWGICFSFSFLSPVLAFFYFCSAGEFIFFAANAKWFVKNFYETWETFRYGLCQARHLPLLKYRLQFRGIDVINFLSKERELQLWSGNLQFPTSSGEHRENAKNNLLKLNIQNSVRRYFPIKRAAAAGLDY